MKNSAPRLAANFSYYTIPEAKLQDLRERNGGKSFRPFPPKIDLTIIISFDNIV